MPNKCPHNLDHVEYVLVDHGSSELGKNVIWAINMKLNIEI